MLNTTRQNEIGRPRSYDLKTIDKHLRNGPLGNALIGGGVNSVAKGVAAGTASLVKSGATGAAVETVKQAIDKPENNEK